MSESEAQDNFVQADCPSGVITWSPISRFEPAVVGLQIIVIVNSVQCNQCIVNHLKLIIWPRKERSVHGCASTKGSYNPRIIPPRTKMRLVMCALPFYYLALPFIFPLPCLFVLCTELYHLSYSNMIISYAFFIAFCLMYETLICSLSHFVSELFELYYNCITILYRVIHCVCQSCELCKINVA